MSPFERARKEALAVRIKLLGDAAAQMPIKAQALLSKVEDGLNLGIDTVPADSHLLGLGDACLRREEQYIYVRDDVSPEHCAELLAHELGHWFLDPAGASCRQSGPDSGRRSPERPRKTCRSSSSGNVRQTAFVRKARRMPRLRMLRTVASRPVLDPVRHANRRLQGWSQM